MALPLSTAKQVSRGKTSGKVVSEYAGKASPRKTKSFNGATNRFRPAKKRK
jgi:hypothetical protein